MIIKCLKPLINLLKASIKKFEGKSIEFMEHLRPEDIISALEGKNIGEKHYIDLAIDSLKNAIKNYKLEK